MNAPTNVLPNAAASAVTNAANGEALAGLRDIHLPGAIGLWPLAPGWWALLAIGLVTAVGVYLFFRARRRSLKRAALRELDVIAERFNEDDTSEAALQLATLLRRVAIARFPRRDVASLHGNEWSLFLLRTGRDRGLTPELIRALVGAVYAAPKAAPRANEVDAWITGARRWIGDIA